MRTRHFDDLPKAYAAYPKVIQGLLQKTQSKEKNLPQVEYVVDELDIDTAHLAKYNRICGFENNGTVPAMYLAVLAQSLQMHMMTSEPFPFVLLGLVHIRNQIKQYRVIQANEKIELACKFGELEPHDKGVQFDFIITAKIAGETVFEGLTTYLSRQKVEKKAAEKAKIEEKTPDYQVRDTWNLAENTGRRYALISGDFNLIHIHAVTAKAFGFKSAIAHGMWSKAKALAAIELPEAYSADIWFKLPMFLPSTVEFLTAVEGSNTDILVRNIKNQRPHLSGEVTAL